MVPQWCSFFSILLRTPFAHCPCSNGQGSRCSPLLPGCFSIAFRVTTWDNVPQRLLCMISPPPKKTKYHSDSYEPSERIDPLLHHGFRGAQYGGSDGNWMGTSILGASITWDPSSASIVYIPRCSTVYVSFASRNGPSSQSYKSAIHGACSMTW
jgi:hypothetical protein